MKVDEIIEILKEGNERYVKDELLRPHTDADRRRSLHREQRPFAVVLSCADSRVVPELIFDQGLGDLFVIRVAGNIATEEVLGSIEYAVNYLYTKWIVVMGHEHCGAVNASIGSDDPGGHIGAIVKKIKPAVHMAKRMQGDLLTNAIRTNAQMVADGLKESKPVLLSAVKSDGLKIVSAYYKLSTGEVEFDEYFDVAEGAKVGGGL